MKTLILSRHQVAIKSTGIATDGFLLLIHFLFHLQSSTPSIFFFLLYFLPLCYLHNQVLKEIVVHCDGSVRDSYRQALEFVEISADFLVDKHGQSLELTHDPLKYTADV
jgi:hypothetical protein